MALHDAQSPVHIRCRRIQRGCGLGLNHGVHLAPELVHVAQTPGVIRPLHVRQGPGRIVQYRVVALHHQKGVGQVEQQTTPLAGTNAAGCRLLTVRLPHVLQATGHVFGVHRYQAHALREAPLVGQLVRPRHPYPFLAVLHGRHVVGGPLTVHHELVQSIGRARPVTPVAGELHGPLSHPAGFGLVLRK